MGQPLDQVWIQAGILMLAYRHIKRGLVSKLLYRAFWWHPWIPGTLKLDSILSLFKCEIDGFHIISCTLISSPLCFKPPPVQLGRQEPRIINSLRSTVRLKLKPRRGKRRRSWIRNLTRKNSECLHILCDL